MDANSFDALTQAVSQRLGRRRVSALLSSVLIGLGLDGDDTEAKKRRRKRQQREREERQEDVVADKKKKRKKRKAPKTLVTLQCGGCGLCASCQIDADSQDVRCSSSCSAQCKAQSLCSQAAQHPKLAFLSNYLAEQGYVQDGEPVALELVIAGGSPSTGLQIALKHSQNPNQLAALSYVLTGGAQPTILGLTYSSSGDVRAFDVVEVSPPKKKRKKGKKKRKPSKPNSQFTVVDVSPKGAVTARSLSSTRSTVQAAAWTRDTCWQCNQRCQSGHKVACAVRDVWNADIDDPIWWSKKLVELAVLLLYGPEALTLVILENVVGLELDVICNESWYQDSCANTCREESNGRCCRTDLGCQHINGAVCDMGECRCPGSQVECNQKCVSPDSYQTDRTNCGRCGKVCPEGRDCNNGSCCIDGEVICNEECLSQSDLAYSQENCGECGRACGPAAPYCRPDEQGHGQCYPCADGTDPCNGVCCGENKRCIDDHCRELLDSCQGANDQHAVGCYDPALPTCCFDEQGHADCYPEGVCSCPGGAAPCGGGCCGENQLCSDGGCHEVLSRCQGANDDNEMACIDPAAPVCCPDEQGNAQCHAEGSQCCGDGHVCTADQRCNAGTCERRPQCCKGITQTFPTCCEDPSRPVCLNAGEADAFCYPEGSFACGYARCLPDQTCSIGGPDNRFNSCCNPDQFPNDGICCPNPDDKVCVTDHPYPSPACVPADEVCCPAQVYQPGLGDRISCKPPQICYSDNHGFTYRCKNPE